MSFHIACRLTQLEIKREKRDIERYRERKRQRPKEEREKKS